MSTVAEFRFDFNPWHWRRAVWDQWNTELSWGLAAALGPFELIVYVYRKEPGA